jgi:hypothetical protein
VHHHDRQWLGTTILGQIIAVHTRAAEAMASAVPRVLATAGIHAATRCADSPSAVASDRFLGVLAPNARLRPKIIPTRSADHAEAPPAAAPARLSWAWLLNRVFDIHLEHCPRCGGPLKVIAAI